MYVLTQLGFGLNVAPKVMTMIVEAVLAKDEQVDNFYVTLELFMLILIL